MAASAPSRPPASGISRVPRLVSAVCRVAIDQLVRERGTRHAQDDEAIVRLEVERVFLPRREQDRGVGARFQRPAAHGVNVPSPERHMQDRALRNPPDLLPRAGESPAEIDVAATNGVHGVSQRSGAQRRAPVTAVVRRDERVDFVEVVRSEPGRVRAAGG